MHRPYASDSGVEKVKSGIYQITHIASGRRYIGSAVDIASRWRVHRCELGKGYHHSPKLQNAWNKYGPAAFRFEVLERVEASLLIEREQAWIDEVRPQFNCRPVAGSQLGFRHSEESRALIGRIQIGKKASEETRRKMSLAHKGRRHTEESKQKMREARVGWKPPPISEETRRRMGDASRGRVFTEQHKQRLAESNRITWATRRRVGVGQE